VSQRHDEIDETVREVRSNLYVLTVVCNRFGLAASYKHESLLGGFERKVLDAVLGGMPKAQAARTFGIGISPVKRYVSIKRTKARICPQGELLAGA
jgi:hypothetical protein